METTDHDLLASIRAGDRVALETLLERHAGRISRFAGKMCRDGDDAKDVVQETLIAAARGLPDFREGSSVSTWLYTVTRSFCIKKHRRSKYAPDEMLSLDDAPDLRHVASAEPLPEDAAAAHELGEVVARAVDTLDPVSREVLLLRDVEGLTAPEVGEVLGLGVEAVKSRLHRARLTLRARLEPHLREPRLQQPSGCPDVVEMFSRHLEGEITGEACATMQAHIASCPACSARCDSLQRTLALCRAAPVGHVPGDVQKMVRAAVAQLAAQHAP